MAHFSLGRKRQLINTPTQFPLTFWDDTYTEVAPAAATILRIGGFHSNVVLAQTHNVKGITGAQGTFHTVTLDATNVAAFGAIPPNTIVNVLIDFNSWGEAAEFVRHHNLNGAMKMYSIKLDAGDGVPEFLAKLYNHIRQLYSYGYGDNRLKVPSQADMLLAGATFSPNGLALTVPTLDLISGFVDLEIRRIRFSDSDNEDNSFVTLIDNPVLTPTVPFFEGRNNFQQLKSMFIDEGRPDYHIDRYTTPIPGSDLVNGVDGALYKSIQFEVISRRDEVGGLNIVDPIHSSNNQFELYINETCVAYVNDLVDFFDNATVLSTANPVVYNAPVWFDATIPEALEVAAAAYKL